MLNVALGSYTARGGNVGDDLNAWLWPRVFGAEFNPKSADIFIGIGSILDGRFQDPSYGRKIVFGSGARGPSGVPRLDQSWDVRFVRGPNTAAALGGSETRWIMDPAVLIARYFHAHPSAGDIGIVPYFRANKEFWHQVGRQGDFKVISPTLSVEDFIAELSTCRRVFAESMHGAIFADALRIPWRAISSYNRRYEGDVHDFKWSDWCRSVELDFNPLDILGFGPSFSATGRIGKHVDRSIRNAYHAMAASVVTPRLATCLREDQFFLSSDKVLEAGIDQIANEAEAIGHLIGSPSQPAVTRQR